MMASENTRALTHSSFSKEVVHDVVLCWWLAACCRRLEAKRGNLKILTGYLVHQRGQSKLLKAPQPGLQMWLGAPSHLMADSVTEISARDRVSSQERTALSANHQCLSSQQPAQGWPKQEGFIQLLWHVGSHCSVAPMQPPKWEMTSTPPKKVQPPNPTYFHAKKRQLKTTKVPKACTFGQF